MYLKDRKLLYASNGYFNASAILKRKENYIFITGSRGTGKTYSTLKELILKGKPFIYLRRTQDESDLQANENTSSLTKVLKDLKMVYSFGKIAKKVGVIHINENPIIYTCALSTFATIRGVNFDDVLYAVYDEFIPETHVRSFKAEGLALMNFYESVNRNRELEGRPALKLIGLSNSLNIANDVFMEFNLISQAEILSAEGNQNEIYLENDKMLVIMKNSPISEKKKKTSLYQNSSEQFAKMAIENKFILNDFTYVQKRNLKEYRIILKVGDLYLYRHKSNKIYYVTFTKGITRNIYTNGIADLERFRRAEHKYFIKYLEGKVLFDSYKAISLFEKYYK